MPLGEHGEYVAAKVVAKFYVAEVTRRAYASGQENTSRSVVLRATSRKDESSKKFWAATPMGELKMDLSAVDGAAAGLWFEERIGKNVMLEFIDAPADE